jgi:hypothetical protein
MILSGACREQGGVPLSICFSLNSGGGPEAKSIIEVQK